MLQSRYHEYYSPCTSVRKCGHRKHTDHLRKEVDTGPNNQVKIIQIQSIISELKKNHPHHRNSSGDWRWQN